ncbi:MAG: hypothetical protein QXV18_00665 [Candidatus Nitrosocaldus sp.]
MVKGIWFKYHADKNDPFLQDEVRYIRDPDFVSNKNSNGMIIPIWAVCGVLKRQTISPGDIVFFIPTKGTHPNHIKPYVFTGVLVCKEKHDADYVMRDPRLSEGYRKRYVEDLNDHLKYDKEEIANKRKMNVVYGEIAPTISRWFGDNPVPVISAVEEADLKEQLKKQLENLYVGRNSSIPEIRDESTVKRLYNILMSKTKPSTITKYEHTAKRNCISCFGSQ